MEYEAGSGSVQLELFEETQDLGDQKVTAFLWGLWVDEPIRRRGVATALMDMAESIAADFGHDALFLEWSIKESPVEIFQWYERRGYDEKEFSVGENANSLMKKPLRNISQ